MSNTTTKKKRPTLEEDKDRADKLLAAYAEMKAELDKKKKDFASDVTPITESIAAAEDELIKIGKRRKTKFIKNRFELTDGYLFISEETIVKELKGFTWSKFIRMFPGYAKSAFNIKDLKQAFADIKRRPKLVKTGRIDLRQEETIKVKLNKADDEGAAN